ncbi:MAG: cadherin-like beta sandwich domain-containing protein [Clostridia bacterium]|nr:cadherin-like beta sandwich domain-containing protein [Clostridia bacterium]
MNVKNKILIGLLIVLILSLLNITVYAAASFSINAGTSMEIEETETLIISTTDCAGKFSISSSNSGVVSVSSSSVFVDGSVMSNPEEIILTAKSAGTATITVTAFDVSDKAYEEVAGSKTVTITVTAPPTPTPTQAPATSEPEQTPTVTATPVPVVKSSNANLKNLGITPNDFSGFTANTTKYYVTVPYEVEKINVYAYRAEPEKQKISGTGDKTLEAGVTTPCEVTVTAEDGTQKTYYIYVTRKSEPTETVPNVVEEPEELLKLSTLEVKNAVISPEFNPDIYEYEVELTDGNIEKLDILATANIENASIEVTGNENFMEGDNTVTIVLKSEDGTKAATYTITVAKSATVIEATPEPIDEEEQEHVKEEKKSMFSFLKSGNTGMIVILVIAIVVLIASIITVVVIIVKNKKEANGEMMSFTPSSEYNVFEEKIEEKKVDTEAEEKQDKEKRRGKHF